MLREDGFIGTHATWEQGILRPYGRAPEDIPVLCFNGSAPLRPAQSWVFWFPVLSLFKSLLQVLQILNSNTVLPRVDAMRQAFERRKSSAKRPDHLDPANLLADLRPVDEAVRDYSNATISEEYIRKSCATVTKWESDVLHEVRFARKWAPKDKKTDWLSRILASEKPLGSFPACGMADMKDWDALFECSAWQILKEKEGVCPLQAPTTLGRIEADLARRLIARGYLNTFLVSLFLAPLDGGQL